MTKRISFLVPDLRGGGAERVTLDLAAVFASKNLDVELVLRRRVGEFLAEAEKQFPIVDLCSPRVRNVPVALSRYLRQRQPDVLIASMWPLTVVAAFSARLAGFKGKVLVTEHGILSRQYKEWGLVHNLMLRLSTSFGYRFADVRVGVSQEVCADMAALSRMSLDRFFAIPNPVHPMPHPTNFAKQAAELLWGRGGKRILSVGNLKRVKNHALLLHAFAILPLADAKLMLVGTGELEGDLRAIAEALGIADRVIFAGFHADPSTFYATADLFVLSSDYEGFGNVIVESLSFGLPVVSTDCASGPREILGDGRWGDLVPLGDPAALSLAMGQALKREHNHNALRQRARDYLPELAAERYLKLVFP